jgi:hypothetical protein
MVDMKEKVNEETDRVSYLLHALRVFYAEALARTKSWTKLEILVQDVSDAGPLASDTYEAIVDIMVKKCIVFKTLIIL